MSLDLILKEFNNENRSDLDVIKAVLPHCSHRLQVSFALHCCLDIEPLMTDKRSIAALRAVEIFLKTGIKPSQEVITAYTAATYAAAAAYAAAYTAAYATAYATAYAAAATADAAADAAASAAADAYATAYATASAAASAATHAVAASFTPEWNRVRDERIRGYLNKLKELVSTECNIELTADASWLMAVVI